MLLGQSHVEATEEKLSDGCMKAETLAHAVSIVEEVKQVNLKTEEVRQHGLHLDSTMHKAMSHLQPSRGFYGDNEIGTWSDFIE